MLTDNPKLRDDIELLRGMDDRPMVYDPRSGVYHHLSELSFALAKQLDGSVSTVELARALAHRRGSRPEQVLPELETFLAALAHGGVLEGTAATIDSRRQRLRRRSMTVMPKFVLTRRLPWLLEPLAARLRPVAGAMMWALVVLGSVGAVWGFAALGGAAGALTAWGLGVAALVFVVQVCLHEAAHALVAQVLRTPVRGAGFALLLWVLPFAFVDRTDAYRLRSRAHRVALALAGPLLDGVAMGVAAAVTLTAPQPVATVAGHLLVLQVLAMLMNLNPVLAGDGYSALEAGFGLVDPRGRAFALLGRLAGGRPLPAHLAALGFWARAGYLGYAVLCLGYLLFAVLVLISAIG